MHYLSLSLAVLCLVAFTLSAETTNEKENRNIRIPNQPLEPDGASRKHNTNIELSEEAGPFAWWPSNLIVAPIPSREPVFGWGLSLFGGMFLDLDEEHPDTPPSFLGAVAWLSENNSYTVGTMGNFNLLDDNVRIDAALFYMDTRYKFYGVGSDAGNQGIYLNANQTMPLYYANAKYQIFRDGYLGLGYLGAVADITYTTTSPDVPPGLLPISDRFVLSGLEIPFQYDTRDNQQYPRDGWLVDASAVLYMNALGSDVNSQSYTLAANRYIPIRDKDVLALRASTQASSANTPVFLYSQIGGREDMRGYAYGRYTDRMAYTLQAEYRLQFHDSWILTGFGGIAEVAPNYGSFLKDLLPAGGGGIRYILSEEFKMNLAFDIAVGRNGTEYYFSLGEAF